MVMLGDGDVRFGMVSSGDGVVRCGPALWRNVMARFSNVECGSVQLGNGAV